MATMTLNINAQPGPPAGVYISSITRVYGSVPFTISGGSPGDIVTIGITTYNTNTDGSNFYIANWNGLTFTPTDTYIQKTADITYGVSPSNEVLSFADNPDTGSVMVEVRIIASTGTIATGYNQYAYTPYDYYP